MNKVQVIKNFFGKIIGYIETDSQGNKTIKDFYKRIKGYYDAKQDVTKNFYKQIIAKGDGSSMLLSIEN
ncbi:hypothetical protein [uncultured Clostridium sp.]|uniref:hypothetical protein n=1 Tax=uncultured Clostridium sp. TaxID=59620 RepID=UPI0026236DFF|nr:hypothetical protein [uncultured Clostridium sp.]